VKTLIWTLFGALAGIAAASYIVPPALSWYTEPGGLPHGAAVQSLVNIPDVIRYSTSRLIHGQMIGAVIGGGAGFVLGLVVGARGRSRLPGKAV
jgi:hypothetical protein